MKHLSLLTLLLLASPATALWTWTSPVGVYDSTGNYDATNTVSKVVDGVTSTGWYEATNNNTGTWSWGLTVDMGQTYNISSIRVYITNYAGWWKYVPCSVGIVKVCDDALCAGESSLVSKTSWSPTSGWNQVSFTTTQGRWLHVEGGQYSDDGGATCTDLANPSGARSFMELEAYTDANPAAISQGPCRVYCDYQLDANVPYPVNGNGSTPNAWKITLTGYGTSPEGETELYTNWSNVQLTITNGSQSGSCAGVHQGNITGVRLLSTDTPNSLILNYTYGESSATCTSTPPSISICLNGTYLKNKVYTSGAVDFSNQSTTYYVPSDATNYFHYNVTYLNEATGGWWNMSAFMPTYTYFFCRGDYDGYATGVNLTSGANSTVVQLRTPADIQVQLNNSFSRWYANEAGGVYPIYLRASNWNVFAFQLIDLTGGSFYRSKLAVRSVVNDTLQTLDVSRFPSENIIYPNLKNNTYYSLILTNDISSRNMGSQYLYTPYPYTYDIIVSTLDLPLATKPWDDLNITVSWTYSSGTITCQYQSAASTYWGRMEVYNYTSTQYVKTYEVNATTPEAVLTYPVEDLDGTYWVKCTVNGTQGLRYVTELINYRNETARYRGFDLNVPSTVMGVGRDRLYMILSLGVVLVLAGVFSQGSVGVGAIVAVVAAMFFAFVGWLNISFWYLFILLFVAIFLKVGEKRSAVVS